MKQVHLPVASQIDDLVLPEQQDYSGLTTNERLDLAELWLCQNGGRTQNFGEELPEFKLTHRFTPGIYVREILMLAGSILTSKIHKLEHPFVVSKGVVYVYSDNDGPQRIVGPYFGVTKPGTRRLLVVQEDTVWTTFHPNPLELRDIEELDREFTFTSANKLIGTKDNNMKIAEKLA